MLLLLPDAEALLLRLRSLSRVRVREKGREDDVGASYVTACDFGIGDAGGAGGAGMLKGARADVACGPGVGIGIDGADLGTGALMGARVLIGLRARADGGAGLDGIVVAG